MKCFDPFALDVANQCLWRGKERIDLAPKPFAVLRYLVEHPDRLVSQKELLEALWPGTYVLPQVLRTYVLELRKLLGDQASRPHYIQTLSKRGYRFLAPVADAGPEPALEPPPLSAELPVPELEQVRQCAACLQEQQRAGLFSNGSCSVGRAYLAETFSRWACSEFGPTLAQAFAAYLNACALPATPSKTIAPPPQDADKNS